LRHGGTSGNDVSKWAVQNVRQGKKIRGGRRRRLRKEEEEH
jgi:hypothetical protein